MLTLQDLCLQLIVEEFDKFHKLYSTTDDESVGRMFEYMQRKHSEYLLEQLQDRDDIKEEYIDFLVNKYLKVFHTQWFKKCRWTTITSKVAEIGSNVRKLNIEDVYFEGYSEETPWQDIICYLPNLQFFSFQHDCHDEILKSIPKYCPNVLEINLEKSAVTNEGMKYLCIKENGKPICSRLKKLSIASTPVNDEGVEQLIKSLPSLEIVDYPDLPQVIYSIHKNDLSSLDKVVPYNIVLLDLLSVALAPFFTDLLNVCLSVCPHLKHLTCPLLSEEQLMFFSKLSDLETLRLECYSNSEIDINSLIKSKGGKLTSLTVLNCIISISSISESCPRLKDLCLNKVIFLCDDNSKPVFHCLQSCSFENLTRDVSTTKATSILLSSCPKLINLSFKRSTLTSPDIKINILKCCKDNPLKNINIFGSVVEIEFVKDVLLSCQSLRTLHLDDCDFELEDEEELQRFAELLPNNPCIIFNEPEQLSIISDYDDLLQDFYDFEDELDDDDYDDYYYNHYDEYDEDEDDDYGYYFEL